MDRHDAVELLRGLVAIPSLSRHEAAASAWLVGRMAASGFDRAFVDEAGNAVGELGTENAPVTVVLLGHIDTVPGSIPVRIEHTDTGDALFGRGSVDAKGPLAALASGAARFGSTAAQAKRVRIVVVGAVEEEAATSKGARAISARFDGIREARPNACVIGEPSGSRRVTLGYKGRLLLDIHATQPMAHTAGPEPAVATRVVDLWNRVVAHAEAFNRGRERQFDQLSPSLRAFNTSTAEDMCDHASATIAWRLPLDCDVDSLAREFAGWAASVPAPMDLRFYAHEPPWRGDRQNVLVRSFLSAIRFVDPSASPGFVLKTGTSDMNVVGPVWKCPIVAYGPGDSSLDHTPREHLHLDEFWRAVQVIEAMLHALADRLAS